MILCIELHWYIENKQFVWWGHTKVLPVVKVEYNENQTDILDLVLCNYVLKGLGQELWAF